MSQFIKGNLDTTLVTASTPDARASGLFSNNIYRSGKKKNSSV
jgi:hypothetical protein